MNILLTGACGYKGSVLVPKLLKAGHRVVAFDIMWFGNFLEPHPDLTVVKGDVRNPDEIDLTGIDAIIHLSSVANDPCGDLDPKLTWEISCLATMQLADRARRHGIQHFIYASSGSVYGIKDEEQVTEDLELLPISEYNKTKMCGERIVLSYRDDMVVQIVRPATVCGYSPRQRLDVSVNMLTMQALMNGRITVFGGNQMRPNLHVEDMVDAYVLMLTAPHEKIHGETFNIGFQNYSIAEIAGMVKKVVQEEMPEKGEIKIVTTPTNDMRSYHVNSDKVNRVLGFKPKHSIEDAVRDLTRAFRNHLMTNSFDDDWYYNVRTMKKLGAK